jgi:hypothetical protein
MAISKPMYDPQQIQTDAVDPASELRPDRTCGITDDAYDNVMMMPVPRRALQNLNSALATNGEAKDPGHCVYLHK